MQDENFVPIETSRMRLIHAAIHVFSETQYEGASIRKISSLAGVNTSLIFFHFKDKEGLYQEVLRFACKLGTRMVQMLPEAPSTKDQDAPQKAATALKANIKMFINLGLLPRVIPNVGKLLEFEQKALIILAQEMRFPRKSTHHIIVESLRPHIDHMTQCIRVLRPDLDPESLFRMGTSIHGQLIFFLCHQELIPLLRGEPYSESDIESLCEHFSKFSLKGLAR